MKKLRLCYDCAKQLDENFAIIIGEANLERWLRSLNFDKKLPCDKCGTVGYTKAFNPKPAPRNSSPTS